MVNVVILASRSSREVKSPRRSSRRASTPNRCSTMLSQDACFGVYVTSNRGWAVSQARVAAEVCDEPLSMIRWMRRCGGIIWASMFRNRVKVAESLRLMRSAMTWPVVTFMAARREMVPWRAYSNSRRASRPGTAGICGCLPGFCLDAGFLVDADQHGARRRVQVQAAHGPGADPEGGVVGAVEPAPHLVRPYPGLGERPAHGGRRDGQAPLAQVSRDHRL